MNIIQELEKEQAAAMLGDRATPDFAPGDTVKVNVKVTEGTRTRIQVYEGVERVFPLYSPSVDSVEVVRRGKVRRAKLYYLRGRRGKAARISEKQDYRAEAEAAPEAKS